MKGILIIYTPCQCFQTKAKQVATAPCDRFFTTPWAKDMGEERVRPADSQKQKEQVYTSLTIPSV